jgi:hypothetical protein
MIRRQRYLPRRVAASPSKRPGARAIELDDTKYSIHGNNDSTTIGSQVSSRLARLMHGVVDLNGRTRLGADLVAVPAARRWHQDSVRREDHRMAGCRVSAFGLY